MSHSLSYRIGLKALAFGLLSTAVFAGINTANTASAWEVSYSANVECSDNNTVSYTWNFENSEPAEARWEIDLVVTDSITNNPSDKMTVSPGDTAIGSVDTDLTAVDSGSVTFDMTWADGRGGIDSRTAHFDTLECEQPPKHVEVCRDGAIITINEDERIETDTNTCPVPEEIQVCRDGKIVTITEDQKQDGDTAQCKGVQVCRNDKVITITQHNKLVTDVEGDSCPQTLGTQTELPKTGAGMISTLGLTVSTLSAGAYGLIKNRR